MSAVYRLGLLGAFHLIAPDGRRLDVRSKKSIALLGLLATAHSGERWRAWIQDKLWGSRELYQAQASLRRELHNLRKVTAHIRVPLIESNARIVRLNLPYVDVDIRDRGNIAFSTEEFLEGMDIAGEEAFEDWLRETRNSLLPNALDADPDSGLRPDRARLPAHGRWAGQEIRKVV